MYGIVYYIIDICQMKIRQSRLEAMRKLTDMKRAEYVKEIEKQGLINEKRILPDLLESKSRPRPTPLKGKAMEVIKETAPWRKGAVIEHKGGMGEYFMYVKAKARPKPKEMVPDRDKKDEAPNIVEAEVTMKEEGDADPNIKEPEVTHEEGNEDRKSPKKTAILTMNQWGKLKDEKRRRDMAKAPWTKTGRRETTTREAEEDGERTVTCEEDEGWEPCGSNDVPKKKQEASKGSAEDPNKSGDDSWKEYDEIKKRR